MFPSKNYSFRFFCNDLDRNPNMTQKQHTFSNNPHLFSFLLGLALAERHHDNHGLNCRHQSVQLSSSPVTIAIAMCKVIGPFPEHKNIHGWMCSEHRAQHFFLLGASCINFELTAFSNLLVPLVGLCVVRVLCMGFNTG